MSNQILLFDMDDVLLEPGGYQRALAETVQRIGRSLGFSHVSLTPQDIAHFEAAGSTSEWDTAAICAALLLQRTWEHFPEARLPVEHDESIVPTNDLTPPDLQAFARSLGKTSSADAPPLKRAEHLLTERGRGLTESQCNTIQSILHNARRFENSITFRMFQELVLGSQAFSQAYNTAPRMHVAATLERYDRPTMKPETYQRLIKWLDDPPHMAAIMTNRPTLTPDGRSGTPEAEIGAQLVGLDHLPLVGLGALSWRSELDGFAPETYLKPSPIHALTGIMMALGEPIESAMEAAKGLERGRVNAKWESLAGGQVWVFEDAAKGLRSAQRAQQELSAQRIHFDVHLIGITTSAPKKESLHAAGAQLFPDLNAALIQLLE